MIDCEPGDILLVSFPFLESLHFKKRPALYLYSDSTKRPYSLATVAMISSQIESKRFLGDVILKDWTQENLLYPSLVKLSKIATIDQNLVLSKLGTLSKLDLIATKKEFKNLFSFWSY